MNNKIQYDTPYEVTKEQYDVFRIRFAGYVAHMEENRKYYIKVWTYHSEIEKILFSKIM